MTAQDLWMLSSTVRMGKRARRVVLATGIGGVLIGSLAGCVAIGPPSLSAAAASPISSSAPTLGGVQHSSNDYGYTVLFPGEPEVQLSTQALLGMEIPVETALFGLNGASMFAVEAMGFPDGALGDMDEEKALVMLRGSISGVAGSTHGEVLSQEESELDGELAVRARLSIPDAPSDLELLASMHGTVEYVVMAGGEYGDAFDDYLATFEFTD